MLLYDQLYCLIKILKDIISSLLIQAKIWIYSGLKRQHLYTLIQDEKKSFLLLFPGSSLEDLDTKYQNHYRCISNSIAALRTRKGDFCIFETSNMNTQHFRSILRFIKQNHHERHITLMSNVDIFKVYLLTRRICGAEVANKVGFYQPIRSCTSSTRRYKVWLAQVSKFRAVLKFLNILPHVRTSSSVPILILHLTGKKTINVKGLDGSSKYMNFAQEWKAEIAIKNVIQNLHSTNNAEFGYPTMDQFIKSLNTYGVTVTAQKNCKIRLDEIAQV